MSEETEPPERCRRVRDLTIRSARPDDVEALTELTNLPGFLHGTLRMPYQSVEETRRFVDGQGPSRMALVALAGGVVVGSAGLERFGGRRAHAACIGMGVRDDHTGRGVGTALMAALLDVADNWMALRRVELSVYTDNAAAMALYRRHGFEVEGTMRAYAVRNGRLIDAYAMARVPG